MRGRTLLLVATTLVAVEACDRGRDDAPTRFLPPSPGAGGATAGAGSGVFVSGAATGSGGDDGVRIEDPDAPCDGSLARASADPRDGARAVGLCKDAASDTDWGVVNAAWTLADGSAAPSDTAYHLGHGILTRLGDDLRPREGSRGLALSSGTAREPGDAGYASPMGFDKELTGAAPDGFPKQSDACPDVVTGPPFDDAALEIVVRAPPEADAVAFDFAFLTYEWPDFVCSEFNDVFVAMLAPTPAGQVDGNVSFDALGNPISVNAAFVSHCACPESGGPPCPAPPTAPIVTYACDDGGDLLDGTGFEGRASTGWLRTVAPVTGGDLVSLRFAVYDSGDGLLDSTIFVDDVRWLAASITESPVTEPR